MVANLRPVDPSEASALCAYVERYFTLDGLSYNALVEEGVRTLLDNPDWGTAFFVEEDGVIAGYVVVTAGFDHEFGGRIAVVTDFFLDEPFRGRGLGASALEMVTAFAKERGYKAIELFVLNHNDRARKLYQRMGFEIADDRMAMVKTL